MPRTLANSYRASNGYDAQIVQFHPIGLHVYCASRHSRRSGVQRFVFDVETRSATVLWVLYIKRENAEVCRQIEEITVAAPKVCAPD